MMTTPDNAAKAAVWDRYRQGRPTRVPVVLGTNPRILLQSAELNDRGWTFEDAAEDTSTHVAVSLQWQHHVRTVLNQFTDEPVGLPDVWPVSLHTYNVYEAAYFGAPIQFTPGQVPVTEPIFAADNHDAIYAVDIEHPLENPYLARILAFWHEMQRVCEEMRFHGRPVRLLPWAPMGTDGPVTVACNLCGGDFLLDMVDNPERTERLMAYIVDAAIRRREAFTRFWGDRVTMGNGAADDSCALLGAARYREQVLPHHRRFFEAGPPDSTRQMHMCGNASHLFPILHEQANVTSFDTGFPVDHGKLRQQLGPDVEIIGGPMVDLLLSGTPDDVHAEVKRILTSGIMDGGRFMLREGNNLPPNCPLANLEAMYQACLEFGRYDH